MKKTTVLLLSLALVPAMSHVLLSFAGSVPAVKERLPLLDVDGNDGKGVIRLSGSVDNVWARRRAVDVAKNTAGVRAVVDLIALEVPRRTDRAVRQDVLKAVKSGAQSKPGKIFVRVESGVVVLKGVVPSLLESQRVLRAAQSVPGAREVRNDIVVSHQMQRPDSSIDEEIGYFLKTDVLLDDNTVRARVERGRVSLSGSVDGPGERSRAMSGAWVPGVVSVDASRLTSGGDPRSHEEALPTPSDSDIGQALRDALAWDPRVSTPVPRIQVDHGIVTLTGAVKDLAAKIACAQDAANTVGVLRVNNRLTVEPATP